MSNHIFEFLRVLRRTLRGSPSVGGKRGKPEPLEYLLVGMNDPLVGAKLGGKYLITEKVGAGNMSTVYKAKQEPIDRVVAVKLLKQEWCGDPLTVKRFRREARAVSQLRHPNILLVMDLGTAESGQPFFVCEFLKGKSLDEVLAGGKPMNYQRAVPIFIQICDALQHAHKQGLIHRDIKPGNIMLLDEPDRKDFVKLVDFGIVKLSEKAQAVSQKLTQKGEIWGSPIYMSPEQCTGHEIDGRSDIYSLGSVLYEALTGYVAFDAKTIPQILVKQLYEMPRPFSAVAPPGAIPPILEEAVFKALAKDPGNRFQTMDEFRQVLEQVERPDRPLTRPSYQGSQSQERPQRDLGQDSIAAVPPTPAMLAQMDTAGLSSAGSFSVQTNSAQDTGGRTQPPAISVTDFGDSNTNPRGPIATGAYRTKSPSGPIPPAQAQSLAAPAKKPSAGDGKALLIAGLVAFCVFVFLVCGIAIFATVTYVLPNFKPDPARKPATHSTNRDKPVNDRSPPPDSGERPVRPNTSQPQTDLPAKPAPSRDTTNGAGTVVKKVPVKTTTAAKTTSATTPKTHANPSVDIDESLYLRKKKRNDAGRWSDFQDREQSGE